MTTTVACAAVACACAMTADQVPTRPEDAKPIPVGSKVPDVKVMDLEGKAVSLKAIASKPTVVVFYRGGWCPFCNRHLSDLRNAEAGLKEMGFQLVAITPDLPAEITKTMGKDKLDYLIYSDSSAEAMKAFGVAFTLDPGTVAMYKDNYKIDLEKSSGQTHHILPVPSVFITNGKGEVKFVHANPDYKVRLTAEEVLQAARKAM
ncbi:MAG: AhpC/TSA family protein [Armatimonadetes bacterium]|nr:AhpC/TSA family protein [Armatimonadota bacterium]MBS1710452.1 AhpC/TSA family protein [Armatimonadota bacterium]MBX3108123.1 AhpC/TSA family protein [Fimbriimonadaceae bacterium]